MYASTVFTILPLILILSLAIPSPATPLAPTLKRQIIPNSNCPNGPYFCGSFNGFPAVVST
jgi:hypothetical protein